MESSSVKSQAGIAYSYIQNMNYSAALCVEVGQYDRAIASLTKALRISRSQLERQQGCDPEESSAEEDEGENCRCYHCSLDGYIQFSENRRHRHPSLLRRNTNSVHNRASVFSDNRREANMHRRFLLRRRQQHRTREQGNRESLERNSNSHVEEDRFHRNGPSLQQAREKSLRASMVRHTEFRNEGMFNRYDRQRGDKFEVYQKLIRIPTRSIHQGRTLGSLAMITVSLITLFNLALVHHLQVIRDATTRCVPHKHRAAIEKTLQLYQVVDNALEQHKQEQNNGSIPVSDTSLQFQMILCNNICHVHQLLGNELQHDTYLRKLLSTLLSVVDYKSRRDLRYSGEEEGHFLNLEGFIANTVPLLLNPQCANAA